VFKPLPSVPDHPALEREVLERWDEERTFERLREQNAGGRRFSFIDGPLTANNPMGVHHAWGRTLKDVFQRYNAARGHDERYQNGFDCQGLWVEVEVEKELGLNSKREIEEYGIAEFAQRCKERVARFVGVMTEQSKRLGMWMDWGNDYLTFSDTNIEYIWRFLKECRAREWLYKGHRSTQWCPRCGTSLSQHEQAGEENYRELEHPSLYVRFPLADREGESFVVWTTTPWTLPANVAAAVKPDAEYGLRDGGWRLAEEGGEYDNVVSGEDLVGLEYHAPFEDLPAQEGVPHRIIPWDEVALDEGTGIVHIAPGAGGDDFQLSRVHGLPVLAPIDESGRFLPGYGPFEGLSTDEAAEPIVAALEERGVLVEAGTIVHRYPICWRCKTPLVFRVVDDWFIRIEDLRQPLLDANDEVAWTPPNYKKRMDDWLRNMDDWNISRKRYFGLPLPFYPCECGELNVIGSRAELEQRATGGLDQLQELHRPWIDEVAIRCSSCNEEVRRIPEVGDAWLDAGIVPLSTMGWQSPERVPHGYGTGAAHGLTGADLPDHAYWEQWFPGLREPRADPPLVLLDQRDGDDDDGPAAVPVGPHLRARPRRDRPRDAQVDRQRDRGERGLRAHGRRHRALAVLCAEPEPEHQLRLRAGGGGEAAAADALELGRLPRHLREHRGLAAEVGCTTLVAARTRPLARRPHRAARGRRRVRVRAQLDARADDGLRELRRGPLQLVHPPVAPPVLGWGARGARDALVVARPGAAGGGAADAVPHRPPLARARSGRGRA